MRGVEMATENERFANALSAVLQDFGIDILQDINRLNALLMDYAPQDAKDRRLICTVLRQGIGEQLLTVKESSQDQQKTCVTKCLYQLKNDTWLSEEASSYAVHVLCKVLNIEGTVQVESRESRTSARTTPTQIALVKGIIPDKETRIENFLPSYSAIGYKAISSNVAVTEVVVPDSIRVIYPKAFCDCIKLKRISLPEKIDTIAPSAFKGCFSLESIQINKNAKYTVTNGMLIDKQEKKLIRVVNNNQNTVSIPDQVKTIAEYAFDHSPASTIVLPANLESISVRAFWKCSSLSRIEISSRSRSFSSTNDGVLHNADRTVLIKYPAGSPIKNYYLEDEVAEIGTDAFWGAINLESITFTNALVKIGYRAFDGCINLSSLVMPSSVKVIGERAFQHCAGLTHIMLPRGITEIGDYAFCDCESVQQINVPQSVERIGHGAFAGCKSLKKIVFQDKVTFIGDGAFVGCPENIEIFVRNNPYIETYCKTRDIAYRKA